MTIVYTTREEVQQAKAYTAMSNQQIDTAIAAASRKVEGLIGRIFYPTVTTKYFDYPSQNYSRSWRGWFDSDSELISVTSVVSGGTTMTSGQYYLEPINVGPPYNRIELNLDSNGAFNSSGGHQRQLAITGMWGYNYSTETSTAISTAINSSIASVNVYDSSQVGVGSLILIGDELMNCTEKTMLDTGQNASALTASSSSVTITGITAGTIFQGETILIDSERMKVVDVSGTTVTVKRAIDGSVLAVHALNADIYTPRTLTVVRGAQGTTAASHLIDATVKNVVYPEFIAELTLAEAINFLEQRLSGYAKTVGSGDNEREATGVGLAQLRRAAYEQYAKRARARRI